YNSLTSSISSLSSLSSSLGRIKLRTIAVIVAITTDELPNTVSTQSGKPDKASGTEVIPTPNATARPTTAVFLGFKSSELIILIPVIVITANTDNVPPPITACGIVVNTAENLGINPAIKNTPAANTKTILFTTLLTVTIPTF